ncbi:MAG: hypothetical protein M3042_08245 [Actinomycetota bacterium]|nr:hypothetical protein [Actinomycetota bacterium]
MGSPLAVSVLPVHREYLVGQPVVAIVRVAATRDCRVEAGSVALRQSMRSWANQGVEVPLGSGRRRSRVIELAHAALPMPAMLSAGAVVERTVSLDSRTTSPSGHGGSAAAGAAVEFLVRAEVRLAGSGSVADEVSVRLVSDRVVNRDCEGRVRVRAFRRCDLELLIRAAHARPGDTLVGTLLIRPHRPLRTHRVVVYLRCAVAGVVAADHSIAGGSRTGRWWRVAALTVAKRVDLSGPAEFPFAVRLPPNACPTLVTPDCSVRWFLRAEVHHRIAGTLRFTSDVYDREINVHTGR